MARPYDDPSASYEWGPATELTPKLVAHGGVNSGYRILKGNPVGFVIRPAGYLEPYLNAEMENYPQPEHHAILETTDVDHYHLGQTMPAQPVGPERYIRPTNQTPILWPDASVSAGYLDFDDIMGGLR